MGPGQLPAPADAEGTKLAPPGTRLSEWQRVRPEPRAACRVSDVPGRPREEGGGGGAVSSKSAGAARAGLGVHSRAAGLPLGTRTRVLRDAGGDGGDGRADPGAISSLAARIASLSGGTGEGTRPSWIVGMTSVRNSTRVCNSMFNFIK